MITDPFFYLVAIPAVLVVGISKGGMGGGLGLLAVPLMSLAVSPFEAAAIMLPILCVMDLVGVWGFRGRFHRANLAALLPGAMLGIVIAALTYRFLDETDIKLLVGTIALAFTLSFYARALRRRQPPPRPHDPLRGALWGTLAGFTSFSVHAGGAPLNIHLLPQRLEKTEYVGTTVIFFAVVNYAKLIPYALMGMLHAGNLATSLTLVALAPLGVWLGMWLHARVGERLFYHLCYGLLLLTALKILADTLPG